MTVQATDQMSAWRPWPVCLITSGAIQYGVPLIDLNPESAHASIVLQSNARTTSRGAAALLLTKVNLLFSQTLPAFVLLRTLLHDEACPDRCQSMLVVDA